MEQLGAHVIKTTVENKYKDVEKQFSQRQKHQNIQWDNYNFPPGLNLIHYDLEEVNGPEKVLVKRLYISYILFFIWSVFNFIDTIIIVTQGYEEGIRIFYSIFSFILFQPMSLWVFFTGYYSLVDASGEKNHYLYGQVVFLFVCLFAVLLNVYSFNGLMMLFVVKGKALALIFCLLEVLLALANLLLGGHNLFVMYKYD